MTVCDVDTVARETGLESDAVAQLQGRLTEAGIEIDDDCDRDPAEQPTYTITSLAHHTSDALAQFLAGHLADARATLGQALAERQQYPSARPALDIGLAALEAALSREEGCAARAAAFGALAQWATAYGPSEVRSNKITHLLLARPGPATVRSACATP